MIWVLATVVVVTVGVMAVINALFGITLTDSISIQDIKD